MEEQPWLVSVLSKAPSLINTPQLMLCLRGTQVLSSLAPSGKVRGFHIVCEGIKNTKGAINLQPNINQLPWARLGGREASGSGSGSGWGRGLEEEGGLGGGSNGSLPTKKPAVRLLKIFGFFEFLGFFFVSIQPSQPYSMCPWWKRNQPNPSEPKLDQIG